MAADNPLARFEELLEALKREWRAVAEAYGEGETPADDFQLPPNLRAELLIMGASHADYVFWIRKRKQADDLSDSPDDQMFWAEEMEAGTGAWGVTAREALDNYLSDDLLDRRRWTSHEGIDTRYPDDAPSNRRSASTQHLPLVRSGRRGTFDPHQGREP